MTVHPVSTGTLCYLFADQLDGYVASPKGEEAPSSGARFHVPAYVVRAWAVTVQRLYDQGAVDLELVQRRQGLAKHPSVEVRTVGELPGDEIGFDAAVLTRAAKPVTVHKLIYRWIGSLSLQHYAKSVRFARTEAIGAGLGMRTRREGRRGLQSPRSTTWDLRAVQERWAEFSEVHGGWLRFRAEHAPMSEVLLTEIRLGHEARADG